MSVDAAIPPPADSSKVMNGMMDRPNGVSNGHSGSGGENGDRHKSHKSSSKDKHRDKDRDKNREKDKHRDKDRERDKDKNRDKHKSSSSHSSSSKSGTSTSKDKERSDKEKSSSHSSSSKDKEKSHHSSSSSHKSSRSDKERSKDKERDKDKHRSREDGKDRSDRDKKDRERDKSSRSEKDKDKDKHKSASSSTSNSKDKDRDKHKSSSSSSSRDKNKHSSKKDKDKHSSSSSSSKSKDRRREEKEPSTTEVKVKEEPDSGSRTFLNGEGHMLPQNDTMQSNRAGATGPMDVSQASSCDYSMSQFRADETPFPLKAETTDYNNVSNEDGFYQEHDEDDGDEGSRYNDFNNENGHHEQQQQQQGYFGGMQQQHEQYQANVAAIKHEQSDVKQEPQSGQEESEDDIPLSKRKKKDVDDAYENGGKKKKMKTEKKDKKKNKKRSYESDDANDDDEDDIDSKKKVKKSKIKKEPAATQSAKKNTKPTVRTGATTQSSPTKGGRVKKEEEEQEVWKWWEEEKRDDGVKWKFLEHKGPVFAPAYEPLPSHVRFEYNGREMRLSQNAEEVAGFYARMLDHDYTSKDAFNENFFKDWHKTMTSHEKQQITNLELCNFRPMAAYFAEIAEKNRNRTKEEKAALKAANEQLTKEYGICVIDGHKEKIGNFKIEPPGLFRGRGEHPKMGLVKRRVMPEDVIINCSKDSKIPSPPPGHRWKEVRHDNSVSWLASWTENVQGQVKYIMLNPSSKLKGEKDWQKYETARRLLKHIDRIRDTYREEWKSKEMRIRQRAVAMYFIDKLALRAGNEKDDDQADTVGCCSLRYEHIELHKELNGKENVVVFDFLGKDSIRYYNEVEVEKRVFKNLELFKENKKAGDDLFDRLNTTVVNEYLKGLMDGLTAKVFRTFNASYTLQKQLEELTDPSYSVQEKLLAYNRANRAVAILCNHQRAVPKTHEKSMGNLKEKIRLKRENVDQCQKELKDLKKSNVRDPTAYEKKNKQLERLKEQLKKLELQETDRDENKTIALGTSKLNYLDPRISVAWCKKFGVPIEKIFNKTQRDKFRWAIDMADETYVF
ncbi:DNA topoisomerase I, mitochondrial [Anopheles marshallii]|uniref:DNA topoisomerase I, mitochondrial n=1 Tax=Anopheles marshallii TaxID=1521116 RepID=UPI00237BE3DC|nr:DNA topoisomerase I, mitochondrial [Anopheles marshallii]